MTTETNIYDYVMAQFDAKRVTQRDVAAGSGVPFSTVTKIAQRQVKDPGVHTIQRLADFFKAQAEAPACHCRRGDVSQEDRRHPPCGGRREDNHREAA